MTEELDRINSEITKKCIELAELKLQLSVEKGVIGDKYCYINMYAEGYHSGSEADETMSFPIALKEQVEAEFKLLEAGDNSVYGLDGKHSEVECNYVFGTSYDFQSDAFDNFYTEQFSESFYEMLTKELGMDYQEWAQLEAKK